MLERARQWWYHNQAPPGPMSAYLEADLPSPRADPRTTDYLAVDLETTGLHADTDAIVSIGYLPISDGRIHCQDARHDLVQVDGSVADSATIHHIRDMDLQDARPESEALACLLHALQGRVLLVHHAPMDLQFLRAACRRHYGVPLIARVVDTLALAQRERSRGHAQARDGELRLHALRSAYRLPRYPAHNALSDALATAELFLAMLPDWQGSDSLPLRTLLR
jgi:DNA polymerase-3 subunit epsilon